MTGSAMPVMKKTGRIRHCLARSTTFACMGLLLGLSLAALTLRARAADAPAASSAPNAAQAAAVGAQVEAALR